ncbi:hypothetical protein F964_03331 [Acinetobacter guillouiae NIPH 991]|uniref:Uncharacterized protein n=1 Tax=Acinetobacter guillouiae NIPH 991 TaxID=1217656 RepID=N8WWQ0_ACIGI|nr:hypothetical protein F964_03331 [Acinetobacter guillouiae NIPH 991]
MILHVLKVLALMSDIESYDNKRLSVVQKHK